MVKYGQLRQCHSAGSDGWVVLGGDADAVYAVAAWCTSGMFGGGRITQLMVVVIMLLIIFLATRILHTITLLFIYHITSFSHAFYKSSTMLSQEIL